MVDERQMPSKLDWSRLVAAAGLATLLIAPTSRADSPTIRLSDAKQSGLFNSGQGGRATVNRVSDPELGEGALKLDYDLPRGSGAGVWAKAFPDGLDADHLDVVDLELKGVGPDQARRVRASVELKGASGTQVIPVDLAPELSRSEHPIDWKKVGVLNEVVVAIGQVGEEPASGSVVLDVRFAKIPWTRKLAESPLSRIGGVLAVAGLLALASSLAFGRVDRGGGREASGLRRDLVQGVGIVLIAGLALAVFELGGRGESGMSWDCLWFAAVGAIVANWWKVGLTGRALGPLEVFQDSLAVGLFAATASPLAILQAPANWSQALQLSQAAASLGAFVYLAAVANRLAATGRHPGAMLAGLIVGTPFVVGSLVMLSSPGMMRSLGGLALAERAEVQEALGRLLVLFLFNEALAQGLALATRRKLLASISAHLALLLVAASAVAAPLVADSGSGAWASGWGSWGRLAIAVTSTVFSQAGLWGEVYLVTGLLMDVIHGNAPSRGSTASHPLLGMKKAMIYSGVFMAILYGLRALWEVPGISRGAEGIPILPSILIGALAFPLIKTIFETFDGSSVVLSDGCVRSYREPLALRPRGGRRPGPGPGTGPGDQRAQSISTRAWFGFAFRARDLRRDQRDGRRLRGFARVEDANAVVEGLPRPGACSAALSARRSASTSTRPRSRWSWRSSTSYLGVGTHPEGYRRLLPC